MEELDSWLLVVGFRSDGDEKRKLVSFDAGIYVWIDRLANP